MWLSIRYNVRLRKPILATLLNVIKLWVGLETSHVTVHQQCFKLIEANGLHRGVPRTAPPPDDSQAPLTHGSIPPWYSGPSSVFLMIGSLITPGQRVRPCVRYTLFYIHTTSLIAQYPTPHQMCPHLLRMKSYLSRWNAAGGFGIPCPG